MWECWELEFRACDIGARIDPAAGGLEASCPVTRIGRKFEFERPDWANVMKSGQVSVPARASSKGGV